MTKLKSAWFAKCKYVHGDSIPNVRLQHRAVQMAKIETLFVDGLMWRHRDKRRAEAEKEKFAWHVNLRCVQPGTHAHDVQILHTLEDWGCEVWVY